MSDEKPFTEYELKTIASSLEYATSAQKELVAAALEVYGHEHGFDRDDVREMLGRLVQARLISEGNRQQILNKMFE